MFGGPVEIPKHRNKLKHEDPDILMPHSHKVGQYAHRAREPNTDYDKRMLHYRQRSEELRSKKDGEYQQSVAQELTNIRHQGVAEKRRLKAKIQQRLNEKLAAYEADVDRRREKLSILLCEEEKELIQETVQKHQNADVNAIEDRKKQCEIVRAEKEAQRLELVRQKRLQQYAARAYDLRPFIAKKRLVESKNGQLQQIMENEFRREAERELDRLWCEVIKKQDIAVLERQTQDAILKHEEHMKDKAILDMQVRAKKMLEEERKAIELSNREEMERLLERVALEEAEELRKRREKSKATSEEVKAQLQLQRDFESQRRKEEHALDQAFKELADFEVAREAAKLGDKSANFKRETALYREYLAELDILRKEEEAKLDKLLDDVRKIDQAKSDEAQCKIKEARNKLKRQVIEGRAKQMEYKRMQAEKNLQYQREENEAMRKCLEKNHVLDVEAKRLEKEAARQYRADLKKQIQYNNVLRAREMKDIEEKLRKGVEQELDFEREVKLLLDSKTVSVLHHKHPFRAVVERFDCHCPENLKEPKML